MAKGKDIEDAVREYLQQSDHHAMLLYGEWGTGKTRFVREKLKRRLEGDDEPTVMVYTTAAGVKNADELMGRLAAAYINELAGIEAGEDAPKAMKLLSAAKGAGLTFLENKLNGVKSDLGIPYAPSSDTLLALALSKDCLVVIDDIERMAVDDDEREDVLLSTLCRLVEEQGRKVLLVSNAIEAIPENVREKIVWRRAKFEPCPEELVDSILRDVLDKYPDCVCARGQMVRALEKNGSRNARQLIRVKPILEAMMQCGFFQDGVNDQAVQRDTFFDVVSIALRLSNGTAPSEPDGSMNWLERDEAERFKAKCASLKFLQNHFTTGFLCDTAEMDEALGKFANRYHPETQVARSAIGAIVAIFNGTFEDEEGSRYLSAIMCALEQGELSLDDVPKALRSIQFLVSVGLANQDEFQCAVELCRQLLLRDASCSRSAIHDGPLDWQEVDGLGVPILPELDDLRDAVMQAYADQAPSRMLRGVCNGDENAGVLIAGNAEAWFGSDPIGLTAIEPDALVGYIRTSNNESLSRLAQAIESMHQIGLRRAGDGLELVRVWDEALLEQLSTLSVSSKTRQYHIEQLRSYLQRQIEQLS